jgi:hypothetical protein
MADEMRMAPRRGGLVSLAVTEVAVAWVWGLSNALTALHRILPTNFCVLGRLY